jgi:hypothetical protein
VSIIGIVLTPKEVSPLGVLGYKPWPPGRTPQLRKGSQIAPKGVADLLLEGRDGTPESPVSGAAENAPTFFQIFVTVHCFHAEACTF